MATVVQPQQIDRFDTSATAHGGIETTFIQAAEGNPSGAEDEGEVDKVSAPGGLTAFPITATEDPGSDNWQQLVFTFQIQPRLRHRPCNGSMGDAKRNA
jgi:hypothetical protein